VHELEKYMKHTLDVYFGIADYTFNDYLLIDDGDEPKPISLWVNYFENDNGKYDFHYHLRDKHAFPDQLIHDTSEFLDRVKYF
jgi:hypothetical protein